MATTVKILRTQVDGGMYSLTDKKSQSQLTGPGGVGKNQYQQLGLFVRPINTMQKSPIHERFPLTTI